MNKTRNTTNTCNTSLYNYQLVCVTLLPFNKFKNCYCN